MKNKINYSDVMQLGFKRIEGSCNVFFKANGYDYFIVEKTIDSKTYFDWDSETHLVELVRMKKKNIISRMPVNGLEELKEWVRFFEGNLKEEKAPIEYGRY